MGVKIRKSMEASVAAAACTIAAIGTAESAKADTLVSQSNKTDIGALELDQLISEQQLIAESENKQIKMFTIEITKSAIAFLSEKHNNHTASHRHKVVKHRSHLPTESELPSTLRRIGGCESAGSPTAPINYHAVNQESPDHTGGFQFDPSTWAGRFGVSEAIQATPDEQNEAALQTYQQRGTEPWTASESCWN